MAFQVLIVTPSSSFGASLQQYLEGMGIYHPMRVEGVENALELSRQTHINLAILDFYLGEYSLRKTAQALQETIPDIRLFITSSQEESAQPVMSELTAVGVYSEPFYLSDLPQRVPEITGQDVSTDKEAVSSASEKQTKELPWLQDITRAAQHLASLSLSTEALAAMIVRQDQLWAYAGQLPQSAAHELTDWVVSYWSPETSSDLVRFVKLAVDGGEYMLYATNLNNAMVLAVVFNAKMPFSRIRSQANYLARGLATPPGADVREPHLSQPKEHFLNAFQREHSNIHTPTEPLFSREDVPPPTPGTHPNALHDVSVSPNKEEGRLTQDLDEKKTDTLEPLAQFNQPASQSADLSQERMDFYIEREFSNNDFEEVIAGELVLESKSDKSESRDSTSTRDLMSVSPSMYSLHYTCVMIPRLQKHKLTEELSNRLTSFTRRIFMAFGWRLEHLEIRPDFLKWVASMPPDVSPGYMMHVMREHNSRFIFAEFPLLAQENPSGDFWAPGYLLMSGQKAFSAHLIKNFIDRTRKEQEFPS